MLKPIHISWQPIIESFHFGYPRSSLDTGKDYVNNYKLWKRLIHIHHTFLSELFLLLMFKTKRINKTNKKAREGKHFLIFSTFLKNKLFCFIVV